MIFTFLSALSILYQTQEDSLPNVGVGVLLAIGWIAIQIPRGNTNSTYFQARQRLFDSCNLVMTIQLGLLIMNWSFLALAVQFSLVYFALNLYHFMIKTYFCLNRSNTGSWRDYFLTHIACHRRGSHLLYLVVSNLLGWTTLQTVKNLAMEMEFTKTWELTLSVLACFGLYYISVIPWKFIDTAQSFTEFPDIENRWVWLIAIPTHFISLYWDNPNIHSNEFSLWLLMGSALIIMSLPPKILGRFDF